MPDHILEHVWLGDVDDCAEFPGRKLNVMRPHQECRSRDCRSLDFRKGNDGTDFWVPRQNLEGLVEEIERDRREPLLVHCWGGIERSPLGVVWWMKERRGYTLDEAYEFVMQRRPIVQDRRYWVR